jgi:hypothetical protein
MVLVDLEVEEVPMVQIQVDLRQLVKDLLEVVDIKIFVITLVVVVVQVVLVPTLQRTPLLVLEVLDFIHH